jgi:hypothetical protein
MKKLSRADLQVGLMPLIGYPRDLEEASVGPCVFYGIELLYTPYLYHSLRESNQLK